MPTEDSRESKTDRIAAWRQAHRELDSEFHIPLGTLDFDPDDPKRPTPKYVERARHLFFRAVERVVPVVCQNLRQQVLPHFRELVTEIGEFDELGLWRGDRKAILSWEYFQELDRATIGHAAAVEDGIQAWCQEFNLIDQWCKDHALQCLTNQVTVIEAAANQFGVSADFVALFIHGDPQLTRALLTINPALDEEHLNRNVAVLRAVSTFALDHHVARPETLGIDLPDVPFSVEDVYRVWLAPYNPLEDDRAARIREAKVQLSSLLDYFNTSDRRAKAGGLKKSKSKTSREHFEWLALWQVGGMTLGQLEQHVNRNRPQEKPLTETNIRSAIRETAKLLNLTRRTEGHVGRPPGKSKP